MEMPQALMSILPFVHASQRCAIWLPWKTRIGLQQAERLRLEQHMSARYAQIKAWQARRWRGGAERLVLFIAATMVVAYEQLKEAPSKEAVAEWKACHALVRGTKPENMQLAEPDDEMLKRWERTTMLEVHSCLLPSHSG